MLNAETPRLKFALFGAHSSLGNALLCELLTRQHEVVALVDELNSMTARPGLRTKTADLYDAKRVAESVAGMNGVLCIYDSPELPTAFAEADPAPRHDFYRAVDALLVGLPRVHVDRLLLIADFAALEGVADADAALQRLAKHSLQWTLVDACASGTDLSIEDFAQPDDNGTDDRRLQLRRIAAGIVDELVAPQHIHQRIHFRDDPAGRALNLR